MIRKTVLARWRIEHHERDYFVTIERTRRPGLRVQFVVRKTLGDQVEDEVARPEWPLAWRHATVWLAEMRGHGANVTECFDLE